MPRMQPLARTLLIALSLVSLLVLGVACDSGGSGSPTAPAPPAGGNASIQGQVSVTGSTGGSLSFGSSAPTGPTAGRALGGVPSQPSSAYAADSSGAGVTVTVAGTSISTTADADGNFTLEGVPGGDITLVFQFGGTTATITISGVQANESITLTVSISGSAATVDDIDRDGSGSGSGDGTGSAPEELNLELDIEPDDWNLNYASSSGTVEAFIRGTGFDKVLLDSLTLEGDNAAAMPLAPVDVTRQGDHVRAHFAKNQVLDLLDDPQPGSVHTVTLVFSVDGVEDAQTLSEDITIEDDEDDTGGDDGGEDDGGEDDQVGNLEAEISPDSWNTNYATSNGTVTAFIRGDGLSNIDLDSIELVGDAGSLAASSASLEGNHVRARFPKNQVLDILDGADPGTEHTVLVSFTANDGADSFELEDQVKVVGKKQDDGEDDGEDDEEDDG